jgi:hypothetical protein
MSDDRIKGEVAAILTRRELVLNRGSDDGVREGMKFAVLNSKGLDVKDPKTGQVLGSVELPKVLVEVVRVQPHLSVARTFNKVKVTGLSALGGLFDPTPASGIETLRSVEKPYEEELDEAESYVKRGDTAVEVRGNEFVSSS